jgi:hypothetical protein
VTSEVAGRAQPPARPAKHEYTLLTVAYGSEYRFLRLQARSLDRYLAPGLVTEIVVIDNSESASALTCTAQLIQDYGRLAPKVRFVSNREVATVMPGVLGWVSQQVLKLLAARVVRTDRYVVLDAKDHLVFPVDGGFFEAPDGRMRSRIVNYELYPVRDPGDPNDVRAWAANALRFFHLDAHAYRKKFTPTVTPFVLSASIVRELIHSVESGQRQPFEQVFVQRQLTEFFLVAAYLIASGRGIWDTYDASGVRCPALRKGASDEAVRDAIAWSEQSELPFFSVHRAALAFLSPVAVREISEFWCRRCLFTTQSRATTFFRPQFAPGFSF